MKSNRVVVTGIGIVSCLGSNLEKILYNVFKGYTGIKALELPSESVKESGGNLLPCRVAGVISESDLDLSKEFSKSDLREKSRPILLAVAAARRALSHSRLNTDQLSIAHRNGVSVGMGMPDLQEIYQTGQSLYSKGLRSLSPYFIPRNLVNMASGHISIETGFKGPNLSSSAACTTGLHSIGDAFRLVQRGDADVMICGSTEAPVCPLSIAGFSRMKALCTDSNEQPQLASRPFDKSRSGFVMSEGAAILILEEVNHALARDATIFGEILGYGLSGDAHHISSPSESGDGAFRCMESALLDSGLRPEDITYVNAHATSTPLGDAAESQAIDRLFGANQEPVDVSSVKGAFGHLLGAAGSLEAAITVLSCHHGKMPPTVNLKEPDVPGRFQHVTSADHVWSRSKRIAITNSFGFGGTNASLCISNFIT